ncbi:huntingtin-interacting protein 1 [Caerostris extrusa]|uniref:Huntingtin-interacting protein 1 n=1 Tax=Caerostris extrusa TaxID=172846 RepID=A0AAV4Q8P6_CAEEX|nr:huntingtin-interacting protein 1 [Caerostris extrusa]
MKEVYSKLREEHITLIRSKAESDKQNIALKTSLDASEADKQSLSQKISGLSSKKNLDLEDQLSAAKSECSELQKELGSINTNVQELGLKLKEAKEQYTFLEEKNKSESKKKFSYLNCIFKEAEQIVQVAVDDLDRPVLSVNNCPPEIFLQQLSNITVTTEQFENSYLKFAKNPEDIEDILQSTMSFTHKLTNILTEGKATSNASPNIELGRPFAMNYSVASQSDVLEIFNKVSSEISNTMKIMEILVPNMSQDQSHKLGDIIERELKQMDIDIEEAAQRIQELLNNSKAGDSGMKLEVNSKILDSCTNLMQAIKVLVHASKLLQEEIVSQGKGTASVSEFYNRNHRWTEGLISAAKVVGLGARFLVNAADKVVSKQTKFEELVVASQQIAAATAQLVIASRVKAERGSEKMLKVSQASKHVTEATGQVVATAKSCAEMVEESEEMDFSKLSLHQAKRLEVESQVRVLELESMLVKERVKLAGLRKKHYQLAGTSEGWEEEDFAS